MNAYSSVPAEAPGQGSNHHELAQRLRQARVDAFLSPDAPGPEAAATESVALSELIRRTAAVYASSVTESTRRAYARRWRLFETWCTSRHLLSLPATSETVMMYI